MTGRISGCTALVTGSADGIGHGIVRRFSAEGATVVAVDMDGEKNSAAHGQDPNVRCLTLDVADPDAPSTARAYCERELGGLDILVNNAGISGGFTPVLDLEKADYDRVMSVNVNAPFHFVRAFAPLLARSGRGRVIMIGSIGSHIAMRGLAAYVISKHAVLGMVRAFGHELGHLGITVNNVEPGSTVTGVTRDAYPPAESERGRSFLSKTTAVGRYGYPEDMASAALFLASEEASYVTGTSIRVDGGMTSAVFEMPF